MHSDVFLAQNWNLLIDTFYAKIRVKKPGSEVILLFFLWYYFFFPIKNKKNQKKKISQKKNIMPYRGFFFGSKMKIGINTNEEHWIESENLDKQCVIYFRIKRVYFSIWTRILTVIKGFKQKQRLWKSFFPTDMYLHKHKVSLFLQRVFWKIALQFGKVLLKNDHGIL